VPSNVKSLAYACITKMLASMELNYHVSPGPLYCYEHRGKPTPTTPHSSYPRTNGTRGEHMRRSATMSSVTSAIWLEGT
jgi:hypothetical protein